MSLLGPPRPLETASDAWPTSCRGLAGRPGRILFAVFRRRRAIPRGMRRHENAFADVEDSFGRFVYDAVIGGSYCGQTGAISLNSCGKRLDKLGGGPVGDVVLQTHPTYKALP